MNDQEKTLSQETEDLQKLVMAEASKAYSNTVVEHAVNPRNLGIMDGADGFAKITGPCGDTMEFWLRVDAKTIADIKFMTDGCGTSIAAGSMATELAKGKTVIEALAIGQQEILDALGGMPEESRHCALLASNTLQAAARDCLTMEKEPWKKAYRKY